MHINACLRCCKRRRRRASDARRRAHSIRARLHIVTHRHVRSTLGSRPGAAVVRREARRALLMVQMPRLRRVQSRRHQPNGALASCENSCPERECEGQQRSYSSASSSAAAPPTRARIAVKRCSCQAVAPWAGPAHFLHPRPRDACAQQAAAAGCNRRHHSQTDGDPFALEPARAQRNQLVWLRGRRRRGRWIVRGPSAPHTHARDSSARRRHVQGVGSAL